METPKDSLGPINPKEITLVNDIAFLNSAKAAISAEIVSDIKEFEIKGKDFYNSHKDPLAKKIFSAKFKATIIKKYRSMFCHQPLSLYDYKALEAISMIEKIFEIKANILNIPNGGKKVFSMINQARTIQKDIRTHSGGYESIRVANWIDDLLIKVMAFSG
ncbi:MAG: hypothetical protein GY870_18450 [archaeon]|nr:hypothetical protein [archaeon]